MADILSLFSNQKRLYSGEDNMAERPNKKLCLGDGHYLLAPQIGCDAATPGVNDLLNVALAEFQRSKSVTSFSTSQIPHYEPKTTSCANKDAIVSLQAMNKVVQDIEERKKATEQAFSVSAMFPANNIRLVSAETSMSSSSSSSTRNTGTTSTTSDFLVNALANQMTEEAINTEVERMILRHHMRRRQSFEQLKAHQQQEAAVAAAAAAANFRPPSMTRRSSFTDDSSLADVLQLLTSGLMQSVPPANPSTQMINALLLAAQGAQRNHSKYN